MQVNPGKLNKQIQIINKPENNEKQYDEDGYPIKPEEQIVRTCWAMFTRTSGTEAVKANADFNTMKCRFLVRYTPTVINNKMYVRYNGIDYNIIFVNEYKDDHRYIEIWCELVSNHE